MVSDETDDTKAKLPDPLAPEFVTVDALTEMRAVVVACCTTKLSLAAVTTLPPPTESVIAVALVDPAKYTEWPLAPELVSDAPDSETDTDVTTFEATWTLLAVAAAARSAALANVNVTDEMDAVDESKKLLLPLDVTTVDAPDTENVVEVTEAPILIFAPAAESVLLVRMFTPEDPSAPTQFMLLPPAFQVDEVSTCAVKEVTPLATATLSLLVL
jgi:hypothetical protein